MRCCANCCWSISSDMASNIIEEQGYDDNIDLAGECCLGNRREISQTICSAHLYEDGSDECLYRIDKLGNGYMIVGNYNGEDIKLLMVIDNGKCIKISGYGDCFVFNKGDRLYDIFYKLRRSLKKMFLVFSDMLEFRLDKNIFINYDENVLRFYEDLGYLFDKEQLLVRKR